MQCAWISQSIGQPPPLSEKAADLADNPIDGVARELRIDRQAEDVTHDARRLRQTGRVFAEPPFVSRLQVDRRRVMNAGADLGLTQMLAQPVAVAFAGADYILVEDVTALRVTRWQRERQAGEARVIARRDSLPARIVAGKLRQPG